MLSNPRKTTAALRTLRNRVARVGNATRTAATGGTTAAKFGTGDPSTTSIARHRQIEPRVPGHRMSGPRRLGARIKTRRGAVSVAAASVIAAGLVAGATALAGSPSTPTRNSAVAVDAADIATRDLAAQRADRSQRTAADAPITAPITAPTSAPASTPGGTPQATPPVATTPAATAAKDLPAASAIAPGRPSAHPSAPTWVSPMPGVPLTSCYGPRWGTIHQGIDFAGDAGTPIHAVGAGTVIAAGWAYSGYGISVMIDHGNGFLSHYAHASQALVQVGQTVTAGQSIALEGSTGDATGPHLHFEIHQGLWNQIDPAPWLRARGVPVGC
jgi:murein DD-endopeptidase MepM/ murein hydrolase activator NlpD